MVRNPLVAVVMASVVAGGCGSSGAAGSRSARPAAGDGQLSARLEGVPVWVQRGGGAVSQDGERAFYGVGIANNIANPALLRTTADNRARNDLAKVLETYSASLMQDYMASGGEQQVEQAIKTFTSVSLRGAEIVDRYMSGEGTTYSLAKLDLQTAMRKVRAAEEAGAVASHTEKVDVEDIFDAQASSAAPSSPAAPRVAAEGSEPAAPDGASDSARVRSGERPAWVDGADPRYPRSEYLCGVGYAQRRQAAENAAFAAISRIFEAHVASVSRDFMAAYQQTGAPSLEVQNVESLTQVSTDKVLSGTEIHEVYNSDEGTIYALGCLARGPAARRLRAEIRGADKRAAEHLAQARGADEATRIRELTRALEALAERESLNAELRIVDPDGVGLVAEHSLVDVALALEGAQQALAVGVQADGPYAEDFRAALIQALTQKGYQARAAGADAGEELDVRIAADVRLEDGGKGMGSAAHIHFARGVVHVAIENVATGRVVASLDEQRKEGHRNLQEAQRLVVRRLADRIGRSLGAKIDAAIK